MTISGDGAPFGEMGFLRAVGVLADQTLPTENRRLFFLLFFALQ